MASGEEAWISESGSWRNSPASSFAEASAVAMLWRDETARQADVGAPSGGDAVFEETADPTRCITFITRPAKHGMGKRCYAWVD